MGIATHDVIPELWQPQWGGKVNCFPKLINVDKGYHVLLFRKLSAWQQSLCNLKLKLYGWVKVWEIQL
jgi:hypothetical protein